MMLIVEPSLQQPRMWIVSPSGKCRRVVPDGAAPDTHLDTVDRLLDVVSSSASIDTVVFRIMFGGALFTGPAVIDEAFFSALSQLVPFFPWYIPYVQQMIKVVISRFRCDTAVALFDTAFFTALPEVERYYALPAEYVQKGGYQRAGFHGLHHQYNAGVIPSARKVVSLVCDTQISVSAIDHGTPQLISLGMTPLEGVMGRSSCGDIDPGVVLYVMKREGYSVFDMDRILKKKSGFVGLTGYDLTFREFMSLYGRDRKVTGAFAVLKGQLLRYIGESVAVLGGADAMVISGRNAWIWMPFLYALLKDMQFLGVTLRCLPWKSGKEHSIITTGTSDLVVCVTSTPLPAILFEQARNYIKRK